MAESLISASGHVTEVTLAGASWKHHILLPRGAITAPVAGAVSLVHTLRGQKYR